MTAIDVWRDYTPAGILYKKYVEPTTNDVWNNTANTVNTVKNTVSDGVDLIKKYWYVPVIVGGVILGTRVLGTVNTARILSTVTKK